MELEARTTCVGKARTSATRRKKPIEKIFSQKKSYSLIRGALTQLVFRVFPSLARWGPKKLKVSKLRGCRVEGSPL